MDYAPIDFYSTAPDDFKYINERLLRLKELARLHIDLLEPYSLIESIKEKTSEPLRGMTIAEGFAVSSLVIDRLQHSTESHVQEFCSILVEIKTHVEHVTDKP